MKKLILISFLFIGFAASAQEKIVVKVPVAPPVDTSYLDNRINQKQNISDTNTVDATRHWVNQQIIKNQYTSAQAAKMWIGDSARFGGAVTFDKPVRLPSFVADPTVSDGDLWQNSTGGKVKTRIAGVTYNLATEGFAIQNQFNALQTGAKYWVEQGKISTANAGIGLDVVTQNLNNGSIPSGYTGVRIYANFDASAGTVKLLDLQNHNPSGGSPNANGYMLYSSGGSNGITQYMNIHSQGGLVIGKHPSAQAAGLSSSIQFPLYVSSPIPSNYSVSWPFRGGQGAWAARFDNQSGYNNGFEDGGIKGGLQIMTTGEIHGVGNTAVNYGVWVRANGGDADYAFYADSGDVFVREKFIVQGAIEVKRTTLTATTTLNATHYYNACNATSAAFSVNLPQASTCAGRIYIIKKIDASANAVTITAFSGDSIEGSSALILSAQWQKESLISTGNGWEKL